MSNPLLDGVSTIDIVQRLIKHAQCPENLKEVLKVGLGDLQLLQSRQSMSSSRTSPGEMPPAIAFIRDIESDIRSGNLQASQIARSVALKAKQHRIRLSSNDLDKLVRALMSLPH